MDLLKGVVNDVFVTLLDIKESPHGNVLHAMKKSDRGFAGFGEVYFSWIRANTVKAWKCHKKMTMNLIVPLGDIRFVFFDELKSEFRVEIVGESRYARIFVPPGLWFGFQGLGSGPSLLLNVANREHSASEVIRAPKSSIAYDWSA